MLRLCWGLLRGVCVGGCDDPCVCIGCVCVGVHVCGGALHWVCVFWRSHVCMHVLLSMYVGMLWGWVLVDELLQPSPLKYNVAFCSDQSGRDRARPCAECLKGHTTGSELSGAARPLRDVNPIAQLPAFPPHSVTGPSNPLSAPEEV